MDRTDLAFAGVVRQAELVRSGEVTSRELVELYLERIERLQPRLNCFSNVMSEHALAEAQQADARRGASDDRPLLGVPIAVKEVHDVAGEVTTFGTDAHGGKPAASDSPIVARLRGAGAVIIGKTTTPELAIIGDTGGPRLRGHAQPLEHRLVGRRLERRQRRGRGGRPLRGGHRVRRGRLDPLPGRRLRHLRAQAPARPHQHARALARPQRGRLRHSRRRGHRPAARRGRRAAPGAALRGGGGEPSGQAANRHLAAPRAARAGGLHDEGRGGADRGAAALARAQRGCAGARLRPGPERHHGALPARHLRRRQGHAAARAPPSGARAGSLASAG